MQTGCYIIPVNMTIASNDFGVWLRQARKARGWTMETLAVSADITQPYVSGLERGIRQPSRDMVERLARALSPKEVDDQRERMLLNAGLKAAGFAPVSDDRDDHEVIDYLRGKPEQLQDKAMKILKAAFDEDDAEDDAGNIGKRSESDTPPEPKKQRSFKVY